MSMYRALIVDDDVAVAGVHQGFVLAHGGFEVAGLAHAGLEAVRRCDELAPDLVLLDIHLPDVSGLEVMRVLRGRSRPADILAITAAREVETVREAVASGVWNYLVKPFTVAALHERLDAYVTYRERHESLEPAQDLDQSEIDSLLGVKASAARRAEAPLPKGLAQPTLELVRRALRSVPDASAAEVAEVVGVARVSARRYLEYLVTREEAGVRPRYGGSGRPENRYSLH